MIKIRKMQKEDIEGVLEVEKESFKTPWTRRLFFDELENPRTVYYVCCSEDEILGYGGMWHVVDEGQITNIAVKKNSRKKGIGSKILEEIINWSKEHDIKVIELEVRQGNFGALELYKKYGFRAVGKRKGYYKEPLEDAVLMDLRLDDGQIDIRD